MALWCAGISPDIASSPQAVGTLMIEIDRIHVDINISSHIQNLKERAKIIISSAKFVPYRINNKKYALDNIKKLNELKGSQINQ